MTIQEYVKVLGARIISYLNLDVAVEGNSSFVDWNYTFLYILFE